MIVRRPAGKEAYLSDYSRNDGEDDGGCGVLLDRDGGQRGDGGGDALHDDEWEDGGEKKSQLRKRRSSR